MVMAAGARGYDTLYYKGGDAVTLKLEVDTLKYPVLSGNETAVDWLYGGVSIIGTPAYVALGGSYYYESSAVVDGHLEYSFTPYVTRATISGVPIHDTIVFVHVYSAPDIRTFQIDGTRDATIRSGDTARITVGVQDILDIARVAIIDGEGDTIYSADRGEYEASGRTIKIAYLPDWLSGMVELYASVWNPSGEEETALARTLTVYPKIEIESTSIKEYDSTKEVKVMSGGDTIALEVEDGKTVELTVSSNAGDVEQYSGGLASVAYAWFKDGKPLYGTSGATVTIPEFGKDYAGTYMVYINDGTDVEVRFFTLTRKTPLGIEGAGCVKLFSRAIVYAQDGVIRMPASGRARIYSVTGQLLYDGEVKEGETVRMGRGAFVVQLTINN